MNERIKELARHAGMEYHSEHQYDAFDEEKFAELIVKECLKEIKDMIVDESELLYPNNNQTTDCVNDRLLDTYDNIIEHFGVEE